ncbi:MAG: hypothetical protein LC808_41575, partial [Actinobacteria bacterium]|nr:hypothetical protein [Actinomycetota bacterium]
VLAWPRPLGMREHDRLGPGRYSVECVGGHRAPLDRYPIARIYLLHFESTVPELDVTQISPGEAMLSLLPHAFSARTPELLERLSRLAAAVPVFRGVRGEAHSAARCLLS